ncbi:MAG TPA: head GIN domain-containing protein [Sphingomicrobium sp.]|nr:head GIN domain-containing protein [Sphingomicrobium sp.]
MRTFLTGLLVLSALAAPAAAATRNFGVESFTKIRVEGPYKVTVTTGIAPFAKASGSATGLDRVEIDVRGDTLIIGTNPSAWGGYPGENPGPVEISVGTHDLNSAALTGAGSIIINRVTGLSFSLSLQGSGAAQIDNVAADQMEVNLAGTASAKLKGHTMRLTALVRGLSSLDAANLAAPDTHITADGSATIDANATDTARVDAWGPATIRLTGHPSCTLKATGSTSVSGCR